MNEEESIELGRSFVGAVEKLLSDRGISGVYVRLLQADLGTAVIRCIWKDGEKLKSFQQSIEEGDNLNAVAEFVIQSIALA